MKNYTTYFLLFITNICLAQISELPNFENFVRFKHRREKGDTIVQNTFWVNMEPKIKYQKYANRIIRLQFYKNGKIESRSEITQELGIDTTTQMNSQEQEIVIMKTLFDIGNGKYEEFYPNGKIKSKGKLLNRKRVGEWEFYDQLQNKTVINYNIKSKISGDYYEYYFDSIKDEYKIKVEGKYKIIKYQENGITKEETRRTGNWKYFSKSGKLIDEAKHIN